MRQLLEFVKLSQVRTFKVNSDEFQLDLQLDFLSHQNKIEELALRETDWTHPFSAETLHKIEFPLKKLSLMKQENLSEENVLTFLNKFVDTLEELELGGTFSDSVYEMVFKKFRKLKVLIVDVAKAPTENSFYHNLRPNPLIKKLVLRNFSAEHEKQVEGFIGNLPNVNTLVFEVQDVPNELMIFISNNLLQLRNLHFKSINGQMFKEVRIASLTSFNVTTLKELSSEDWKLIVKAFPNVSKISVKTIFSEQSVSDREFNIITKGFKNLCHLKLGCGFVALKRIFNQLLRNCEKLKTVEVMQEAFESSRSKKIEIFRDFKKDGLRFITHSSDDLDKIFDECYSGLWHNEEAFEDFFDSDDDDDSDLDNLVELGVFGAMMGAFGFPPYDSDSSDNRYVYFDSDGDMREWDEDPSDYRYFDEYF